MRRFLGFVAAALLVGSMSAAANAGVATFWSNSDSHSQNYYFTGSDGVQIVASATSDSQPADVWRDDVGLGVTSGRGDVPQVDIFGPDEILYLDFSTPVQLTGVMFGNVGMNPAAHNNDEFKLVTDTGVAVIGQIPGGNIWDTGFGAPNLPTLPLTSWIAFTAPDIDDAYKVCSITYNTPAVPLPAAAWAGLGTLGLLAVAGLKKKLAIA